MSLVGLAGLTGAAAAIPGPFDDAVIVAAGIGVIAATLYENGKEVRRENYLEEYLQNLKSDIYVPSASYPVDTSLLVMTPKVALTEKPTVGISGVSSMIDQQANDFRSIVVSSADPNHQYQSNNVCQPNPCVTGAGQSLIDGKALFTSMLTILSSHLTVKILKEGEAP